MAATTTTAGSTRSRLAAAIAFACLITGAVAIGASAPADAVKPKILGHTKKTPKPSCPTPEQTPFPPRKGCQVFGEVTGFQIRANGKRGLMKAPADGKIVAWSVDLARPDPAERKFFSEVLGDRAFNGAPTARLSILTRAKKRKFRLRAQSPTQNLKSLLDRRHYFTLNNPISVKKGWIAALTSQTWVPNFAHNLPGDDLWRASREPGRCDAPPQANLTERSRPHLGVGSTRTYGCSYNDARLLYWAYFVKD